MSALKLQSIEETSERLDFIAQQLSQSHALPTHLILPILKIGQIFELPAGQTLLHEEQKNQHLYLLIEGEIEMSVKGRSIQRLSKLGECVGDDQFWMNDPAQSSVKTVQKSILWSVDILAFTNESLSAELMTTVYKLVGFSLAAKFKLALEKLTRVTDLEQKLRTAKLHLNATEKKLAEAQVTLSQDKKINLNRKNILICHETKKFHSLMRTSLMGAGALVFVTDDASEAIAAFKEQDFDAVLASPTFIEVIDQAKSLHSNIKTVLCSDLPNAETARLLLNRSTIDNLQLIQDMDKPHFIKTLTLALHKMIHQDLFGCEKYLNPGTEVHSYTITSSLDRTFLRDRLESFLSDISLRKTVVERCMGVTDELLMNAIFDAPRNKEGKPKFNHLPRTHLIELQESEQGQFFFACDGLTVLVGVHDPFGALDRETFLKYLDHNYHNGGGQLDDTKAGGGHGFHLITESADTLIVNVKEKWRTEIIALFQLPHGSVKEKMQSHFQVFFES